MQLSAHPGLLQHAPYAARTHPRSGLAAQGMQVSYSTPAMAAATLSEWNSAIDLARLLAVGRADMVRLDWLLPIPTLSMFANMAATCISICTVAAARYGEMHCSTAAASCSDCTMSLLSCSKGCTGVAAAAAVRKWYLEARTCTQNSAREGKEKEAPKQCDSTVSMPEQFVQGAILTCCDAEMTTRIV